MKSMKLLFLIIFLSSNQLQARLYCDQDINGCHELDYACQMAKKTLKHIFDAQEKWSEFFVVDSADESSVTFSAKGKYCSRFGHNTENMASIYLNILIDTSTHKKYQVSYTSCGHEQFLTEHWEVKGKKLKPLVATDIYLHKKRQIVLSENETFKDFYITSKVSNFKIPGRYLSFRSIYANVIFRSAYQKYDSLNDDGKKTTKTQSFVWLFDKMVFSQITDLKSKNTYKFNFESPRYSFARRGRSDICYNSEVNFSNDEKGKLLIYSSKNLSEFGMDYEQFKKDCAQKETDWYLQQSVDLFKLFFENYLPQFSNNIAEDQNRRLRKEIEELISFIESGDREVTLLRVRQLLQDVKNKKILDAR